ncbi:MutS-related protein [Xanthovirga aplysinae]|uniref:MutS-related protein n=1 Tax=Xanthovirga aplysinae TaxID=2529853 RepID=UPI0012BBADEF|nr:DNA mismatch repair protein MutS [Xanthovirga aplysinae]MTI32465.1 DNA mismatch repair protein MutS [Xanthovirga aplysinae]
MNIYQNNIHKYKAEVSKLAKELNQLSTIRLIAFLCSIALIIFLANERWIALILTVGPLLGFGFALIIKRYNRIAYLKRHATFLKEINENEVLKLENKLSDFPTGQEFIRRDHAYVSDLDIFGSNSLFQLLNRTTAESGKIYLAKWLSEPASKDVILERQKAIKELSSKFEWRQDFQASGMHFQNPKSDYKKLLSWIKTPEQLIPNQSKYLIATILLSLSAISATLYFFLHAYSPDWFTKLIPLIIILTVNQFFLRKIRPITEETLEKTHQNTKILAGYQSLIKKIESENFDSALLKRLQSALNRNKYSASGEINRLKNILEIFQLTGNKRTSIEGNKFYLIFNLFFLLDVYWIILTEKWKSKNRDHLDSWVSAISEFEVLSSLAGFSYSNPSFSFPEIKDEPYSIQFEKLGHPLINTEIRVCNHFNLSGQGKTALITGSNMAGKSTFLRTLGVNLVLGFMGAPCCAKSAQISHMKIFSSMRTLDNLEEGISSFYAELRRIEQLLDLIKKGQPIFFLLDEMFKGTNSKDRHKGGFSLIKQLEELNAFGMISTHDLELAILAKNQSTVTNYSFNSEIREGKMSFNYKLTEGICKDFNASELMKRSGIKVLSDIEKI